MSTNTTTTSKPLKPKRGTTAQNNSYTGEEYEVTLDAEKHTLRVHDGVTAGGYELQRADLQAAKDAEQDAAIAEAKSSADAASDSAAVSFDVDGLDLVITYGNGTTERVKLPTGKGVGDKWWGVDPKDKPSNVQLYSGQLLSRSAYPDHWGVVNGQRTVLSESEWQAQVSANGFCPFYSSGDGSTTYRMPMVKGVHPKFVAALAEAGQYVEAGAPNITGDLSNLVYYAAYTANGAFAIEQAAKAIMTGSQNGQAYKVDFNASRCSSVYRDDCNTIQPPAVSVILGEYVVGSVAVVGEADAESLLAGQTLLDAKVGALEGGVGRATAYITETWQSGYSWYRKWSDGWIEQGGIVDYTSSIAAVKFATVALTLNVPFTNLNYTFNATSNRTNCYAFESDSSPYNYVERTLTKVVVGFRNVNINDSSSGIKRAAWYACGY